MPTSQSSELGTVIYANSITLTPGTVSVDIEGDEIIVHALTQELMDGLTEGDMDKRLITWKSYNMFIGATVALLIAMALVLYRAFAGPTLFDRVLSANSFGTKNSFTNRPLGIFNGST